MNFLDKLERKYGRRFGIKNLMLYVVLINFAFYFFDAMNLPVYSMMTLVPGRVLSGEIWRLVTFIFIPPNTSMLFIAFVLYLYYMIGSTLENVWGVFKFNLFYLIGILGTILGAFLVYGITGVNVAATAYYINLSLFLAFAALFPNYELRLFFILPVKMKWLAYLDLAFLLFNFITGGLGTKIFIVVSLLNILLFFSNNIFTKAKQKKRKKKYQAAFESKVIDNVSFHKCTICGVTEKDNPNMQFRYCSKCNGTYEYCMDHLQDHEHIQ
ncbi:rhomboid family intramembrane serine protease [Vallitalea okinawensis]|uniref:rhomboid family intramembrane serine protease n=1 Tax=Vallitalea okinawensis TaxID=2078660 RepID=UPI000CFDA70E|nr:hypothetical protein [Vallitalea okinawensis]